MLKKPETKMMIDLHGKSVQEVKKQLAKEFALIEEKHIVEFYIITGKGNHLNSDGNKGVLKKILPKLLKPYSQHISEINSETGAYKVVLKKQTERNPLKEMLSYLFGDEEINYAKLLTKKAEQDDINALIELALIHSTGALKDFSDPQKAIALLERAKQLGAMEAYLLLGEYYREKSDYKKAIEHFKYAALNNDPIGQLELAGCYLLGQGVKQNDAQALHWMTKSADQGHAYAQNNLGRSYYNGEFTPQNIELAIKYLTLAADQGMPGAMIFLARCYATGEAIQQNFKKAFSLYLRAAQWNDVYALYMVGQYLLDGRSGSPPSKQKAFPWFMKGAELGDSDSQVRVAISYLHDEKDIEKGLVWLQKAIEQKNKDAYYVMGCVCWDGITGIKDEKKAYDFIKLSAETGCALAQFELAVMLLTGINKAVNQDEKAGMQWLQKAADQGHPRAVSVLRQENIDEIRAMLKRVSKLAKGSHKLDKFLEAGPDDKIKHLIEVAKTGEIFSQALALQTVPDRLLSPSERDDISKSFWQQKDQAVLAISDVKSKFIVIDAYLMNENLTEKQKTKIMRLLNTLAEQKYPQAFRRLGSIYFEGLLGEQDLQKAEHHWLQGAELGGCHCLCSLGYYYEEKAKSDPAVYQKAISYHERATKLGSANSYNELGVLYKDGRGVEKNRSKAAEYFREAIRLDSGELQSKQRDGLSYNPVFVHASYNIAGLYFKGGDNFPCDKEQAIFWYKKSAEAGSEDAKRILKLLGILSNDKIYHSDVSVREMDFWNTLQNIPKLEKINPKDILNEFTKSLDLEVDWKITKKDQAWCYIKSDDLTKLEKYSLAPFIIKTTADKKSILLLEKVSAYELLEVTNGIKVQMQLSQLTL